MFVHVVGSDGIVDHHCLDVCVYVVDIGGIVDYHGLKKKFHNIILRYSISTLWYDYVIYELYISKTSY